MANPQVIVEFIAKVDDLKNGFKQAETSATTTSSKLKSLGKAALVAAGAAGLGALVYTLKTGIDEYTNHAKVAAQTNAVIKSTGDVSNVTAKHVEDLAGQLLEKSGVDDEVIQSGENLLLTFRNIRNEAGKGNDVFDQATKATLDLSVALGKDMQSSALLVGKALNDPVKGLTALRRVGVQFTSAQEDQIKAMVKSGDTMDAQKVILAELTKEFGGSAAAAGKTLPGQLSILRQNFNNLAGSIVSVLAPALGTVAKLFADNPGLAKAVTIGVLALAAAMVTLNVALAVTAALTSPITLTILGIVAAIAAVTAAIVLLITHFNEVVDWLKEHWDIAALVVAPFLIIPVEIAKHADAIYNAAWSIFHDILTFVQDVGGQIVSTIGGAFANVGSAIYGQFNSTFQAGWNTAQGIKDGVTKGLAGIGSAAWAIISNIGDWIAARLSTIFNWGWSIGAHIVQGAASGISGIAGAVWSAISGIGSLIAKGASTIFNWGWNAGRAIWNGLVAAVKGVGGAIVDAIKAPINAVISAWNSLKIGAFTINLPAPIPDIHFGGIGLPNLPYLAAGGIVTGPTIAMIGEAGPEMVLPLGAGGAPVEVHVYIGETELRSMVRTEVVTENNRTAQTLLAGLGTA